MKKALFITIFAALAVSSFADQLSNRSIFIEGSAIRQDHYEYFLVNFRKEALGTGNTLANHREEAAFIFKFDVSNNPYINEDGNAFVLTISLINNINDNEILFFHFFYNTLEEMLEHNQFLFYRAVAIIPPLTEEALLRAQSTWKDKWIYLRASFDYPVSFYALQSEGLLGGVSAWAPGPTGEPSEFMPLDNKIFALPGVTIGAEFQFLDFMSFEMNFKANMGDPLKNESVNLGIGAQLKFSIKYFKLFNIQPYIVGHLPLVYSDIFTKYPSFALGGGIQLSAKGGKNGAFYIDVNYTTAFSDAVMKNPYPLLFPFPKGIHFRPSFLGIGIGYKHGFIDRPVKPVKDTFLCDICGHHHEFSSHEPEPAAPPPEPVAPPEQPPRERTPRTGTFYF